MAWDNGMVHVCSKTAQIRTYDHRVKRKPILQVDLSKDIASFTTMRLVQGHLYCGDTTGCVTVLDARTLTVVKRLREASGAIKSVWSTSKHDLLTCSADRWLRYYVDGTLTDKHYLKQRPACALLWSDDAFYANASDELWDMLDTVEEPSQKRRLATNTPSAKRHHTKKQ
jgi:hypothetical protein